MKVVGPLVVRQAVRFLNHRKFLPMIQKRSAGM